MEVMLVVIIVVVIIRRPFSIAIIIIVIVIVISRVWSGRRSDWSPVSEASARRCIGIEFECERIGIIPRRGGRTSVVSCGFRTAKEKRIEGRKQKRRMMSKKEETEMGTWEGRKG